MYRYIFYIKFAQSLIIYSFMSFHRNMNRNMKLLVNHNS
nr:MAG TPA_asm: hypothetical protein [Caudoviricetes sp.]